jgi:hypothetical protein
LRVFERARAHRHQATAWAFSRMHKLTGVKGVFSSMHKHTGSKLLLRRLVACFRACTSTQAASYCLGLWLRVFERTGIKLLLWRLIACFRACTSEQKASYWSGVCLLVVEHAKAHKKQATALACVCVSSSMHKRTGIKILTALAWVCDASSMHKHIVCLSACTSTSTTSYCPGACVGLACFESRALHSALACVCLPFSMHKHTGIKLLLWGEFAFLPACTGTRASSYCSGVCLPAFEHAQAHGHQAVALVCA